ncbi:zinc finger, CCHC-type containing protein [Tanacetum coccineum]
MESLESKYMAEDALQRSFFHLRIEEGLINQELDNNPNGKNQIGSSSVNMVEGDGAKNSKNNKNKRKFKSGDDKFANKGYSDLLEMMMKLLGGLIRVQQVMFERIFVGFKSVNRLKMDYNVLYVHGIRKNLVSEIVLNKCGYKQVLESDKYILSRHGSFVGFGYVCNGMIRLNLNYPLFNAFACMITSSHSNSLSKSELWHARLGHIHYKRMRDMSKMSLIPAFDMTHESCKTCMLTKITRQPFKGVNRESKVLDLMHSDLCDFHANPSLGNNKAVVRLTEPKMKNMGEKGIDCIFIGYAEYSKCYRFYVIEPNDYVSVNSIIESRYAIFDEDRFTSIPRPRGTSDKTLSQRKYYFIIEEDPRTLSEAMASRDVAFWKEAIQSEIDSIMHNDTWELTDLPPECKALRCFRQKKEIDFFVTYAHVARISTIRLLLALAAIHDLVIHQMDVKTTFLNGDLDEEIYMKQPKGFVMLGHETKLCRLKKSLYGLKQAPKQWHQKFDDVVLSNSFSLNQADKCVYSKIDAFDLGEAEVILGIRIKRGNNDPSVKFRPNKGTPVSQLEYSRAIGCLMHAMISTRLDIAFAYLKGTMDYGLTYSGYPSVIEGYSDASWINNMEDHSSTSGWVFLLGGGAISWASKKQTCITSSTMESEFVALAAAGNEAEWLRNLVYEIPLWPKPMSTISIRCDVLPWLRLIVKCTMASLDT